MARRKKKESRPEVVERVAEIISEPRTSPARAMKYEIQILDEIPDVTWAEMLDGHNLAWRRREEK